MAGDTSDKIVELVKGDHSKEYVENKIVLNYFLPKQKNPIDSFTIQFNKGLLGVNYIDINRLEEK